MPIKHLNVKRLLEAVRAVTWQTYVLPARDKTPVATSMIVPPTIDSGRVSKDDPAAGTGARLLNDGSDEPALSSASA